MAGWTTREEGRAEQGREHRARGRVLVAAERQAGVLGRSAPVPPTHGRGRFGVLGYRVSGFRETARKKDD